MNKLKLALVLLTALLTTYLLRDFFIGSNWVVIFIPLVILHAIFNPFSLKGIKPIKLVLLAAAVIGILVYGKSWSAVLLVLSYMAVVADTIPDYSGYFTDFLFGIEKTVTGLSKIWTDQNGSEHTNPKRIKLTYVLIPLGFVIVFTSFYSIGSTFMASLVGDFFERIGDFFGNIFEFIDAQWFVLFLIGISLASAALVRMEKGRFITRLSQSPLVLVRSRKPKPAHIHNPQVKLRPKPVLGLKVEYKLATLVLISLNLLLAITNGLDVGNLWFNFDPSSVHLSHFVHGGTYILIFSIVLASLIILFYYRGNINFLPKSSLLRKLSVLWLIQNAILAMSVAVRNYHYVNETHALTDKRIGVFVFLIMVLVGLGLLYLKVRDKRTISWLVKSNFLAVMLVVSAVQLVNWERIIISYNFSNPKIEQIDVDQLFREIDYELTCLDEAIKKTDGQLRYASYSRLGSDAYNAWNNVKHSYFRRYEKTKNKSWNYFKSKNLNELNYEDVNYDQTLSH